MKWFLTVVLLMTSFAFQANAAEDIEYEGPAQWQTFDKFMRDREEEDRVAGLSYMISGVVATLAGSAGYYSSEDTFSRGAYAITQSVGIAAIGYGASVYWNGNEYNSFYRAIRDSSISASQKTEILQRFLANEKDQRARARWIRAGTHFVLAAVNFYSASREKDKDVKNIFNFLGGVNAVIGFSYAF